VILPNHRAVDAVAGQAALGCIPYWVALFENSRTVHDCAMASLYEAFTPTEAGCGSHPLRRLVRHSRPPSRRATGRDSGDVWVREGTLVPAPHAMADVDGLGCGEDRPSQGGGALRTGLTDPVLQNLGSVFVNVAKVVVDGQTVDLLILGGQLTLVETAEQRE